MEFLGAGFVDAFLSVLAIIGIILVGGFLIFFLGDIVLSILDPNYVRFGKRKKAKEEEKEEVKEIENKKEKVEELEFSFDEADEDAFTQGEELKVVIKEEPKVEEPIFEEVEELEEVEEEEDFDSLKAEEELFKQNMLKEIEERRQKQLEEQNNQYENLFFDDEDIAVFDDEGEELDGFTTEEVEETVEEATEEPVVEEPEETTEEVVEEAVEDEAVEDEAVVEEAIEEEIIEEIVEEATEEPVVEEPVEEVVDNDAAINALKEEFEAELAKLRARNEELEAELESKENNKPTGSVEEYEARLETLKERLSANEKELRKVKKEYLPLRKVNRTLENDEKKLRRKEAIVAKQKVVLYGVNNIADIDEEKAKKLSEDLDLLEGLKLSVQHCQEVMNANKDRYPILENTFNILTANNETLKEDIRATEEAIAALKETDEE